MKCDFSLVNEIIDTCEPTDLLAKLAYLKWLMKTDAFSDLFQQPFTYADAQNAAYYVLAYLLSHHQKQIPREKIGYTELTTLIKSISSEQLRNKFACGGLSLLSEKLSYAQTESGELMPAFYGIPFGILECEDELMYERFQCTAKDLYSDFARMIESLMTSVSIKGITVKEFVEGFDEYCGWQCFVVPKEAKSYKLLESMSCKFGQLDATEFNPLFPISLIKKSRKFLLDVNGIIYCFYVELFPNLILRCVERACQIQKKQNPQWDARMKEKTEALVCESFQAMFKGCIYHRNSEFKNPGVGESDGLLEYGGYLLIIEVKAGKISPDPVVSDNTTVHSSFDATIGKAERQCDKVEKHILSFGGAFDGPAGKFSLHYNEKHIIKIAISFEDLSAVLPDQNIQNAGHAILITFYDLLLVFDFINEPLLMLKYFLERKKVLIRETRITDEMTYLGLFTTNLNFADDLNYQEMPENATVFLDPESFGHDIEMYYTQRQGNHKPVIRLNEFQSLVLKILRRSRETAKHYGIYLLSLPCEFGDKLISLYRKNNSFGRFAPQIAGVNMNDGTAIGVMASKRHRGDERFVYYAIAKRFFSNNPNAAKIISIVIDEKDPHIEEIACDQKELSYQKTTEALQLIQTRWEFKRYKLG